MKALPSSSNTDSGPSDRVTREGGGQEVAVSAVVNSQIYQIAGVERVGCRPDSNCCSVQDRSAPWQLSRGCIRPSHEYEARAGQLRGRGGPGRAHRRASPPQTMAAPAGRQSRSAGPQGSSHERRIARPVRSSGSWSSWAGASGVALARASRHAPTLSIRPTLGFSRR